MLNHYQIKKLIALSDSLDRSGHHKEADHVDRIIKEAGLKGKVLSTLGVAFLLGANALLYNQIGITPENFKEATELAIENKKEIKTELDSSDFVDYIVVSGDSPNKIGKKHFPYLNEVTAGELVIKYNTKEVMNLQPGDVLKIPKTDSLQEIGWELLSHQSLSEPTKMKASQKLKDWLKVEEGFKTGIYDTGVGTGDLTFGWGHKLTEEEKNDPEKQKKMLSKGSKQVFKEDIERIQSIINNKGYSIFRDPSQNQNYFDALLSLAYHKGHIPNDIDEAIRKNELDRIPELFLGHSTREQDGNEVSMFEGRRGREAEIWKNNNYIKKDN